MLVPGRLVADVIVQRRLVPHAQLAPETPTLSITSTDRIVVASRIPERRGIASAPTSS